MLIALTANLKLQATPEQFHALRRTQLAYRDALNEVSRYAFAHDKMSKTAGLQAGTHLVSRSRFGLPAQLICSVPRQVGPLQDLGDEGEGQRRCAGGGLHKETL